MQDNITKIFKAIADPTRREIFQALIVAATALPINQVASQFDMSRQGVTKHLKTLEDAGLITVNTRGRERYCLANAEPLKEVNQWVRFYEQFWENSLDSLEGHLDSTS